MKKFENRSVWGLSVPMDSARGLLRDCTGSEPDCSLFSFFLFVVSRVVVKRDLFSSKIKNMGSPIIKFSVFFLGSVRESYEKYTIVCG